jgi:hypothetical protein
LRCDDRPGTYVMRGRGNIRAKEPR